MKAKVKKCVAWTMFLGGFCGFVLSGLGILAPHEPRFVLELSWAAIWMEGVVGVIAADDG